MRGQKTEVETIAEDRAIPTWDVLNKQTLVVEGSLVCFTTGVLPGNSYSLAEPRNEGEG